MLRNIGEEEGIGMPRTTTPSSVMALGRGAVVTTRAWV
jgi:hypothetical protein